MSGRLDRLSALVGQRIPTWTGSAWTADDKDGRAVSGNPAAVLRAFARGWRDAAVYDRQGLPAGARLPGPAILEQSDATTFVDPGLEAGIDRYGNAVVTVSAAPPAQVPQPGVRP